MYLNNDSNNKTGYHLKWFCTDTTTMLFSITYFQENKHIIFFCGAENGPDFSNVKSCLNTIKQELPNNSATTDPNWHNFDWNLKRSDHMTIFMHFGPKEYLFEFNTQP